MLAYRLLLSSSAPFSRSLLMGIGPDFGKDRSISFGRFEEDLWDAETLGTSPTTGETFVVDPPFPVHELKIELRSSVAEYIDVWRITFRGDDGLFQRWLVVRFAGKGERVSPTAFVISDPV